MNSVFFLSALSLFVHVSGTSSINEWTHFTNFQERFRKSYDSISALETRFQIFRSNLNEILTHNADTSQNFTLGVNQFSDLTREEFKTKVLNRRSSPVGSFGCSTFATSDTKNLPDSVDWRDHGVVSKVKDQGQCGSCWAFSATAAIESAWAISKGQLLSLAEQEFVDCATGILYGSHGCNGGQEDGGFKYAIKNGQCLTADYPYTSGVSQSGGTCSSCKAAVHISACSDVTPNDQLALKAAVSKQPVSIAIEADTLIFQSYSSGILDSVKCGTELDHAVLIVGYGEEGGQKYWWVRNSWSDTWGDKGYVRIARSESTNDAGICGVAMDPSFPTV